MAKFHKIKVKDIYKETDDCSVITFDVPDELAENFNFRQGQHLTLKADINGEDTRRSYSLCSSPVDKQWTSCGKINSRWRVFNLCKFKIEKLAIRWKLWSPAECLALKCAA